MKKISFNEWLAIVIGISVIGGIFILGTQNGFGFPSFFGKTSPESQSAVAGSTENNTGTDIKNVQDIINSAVEKGGLVVEDLKKGDGDEAKKGMLLTVHYTGRLLNGYTFDSSLSRGVPFQFTLGSGQVIAGWERGVEGMRVGGERLLVIPPELAYGERSVGSIPANSTLVFEVELLGVAQQ